MGIALGCNTFSSPRSLILAFFMHRRKQPFLQAPACNRLVTSEMRLITFGPSHLGHLVLIRAGLQQRRGSRFTVLIGQKATDLSWMGIAWTSLSAPGGR